MMSYRLALQGLVASTCVVNSIAFSSAVRGWHTHTHTTSVHGNRSFASKTNKNKSRGSSLRTSISEECLFTPEGYGFSSPMGRILSTSPVAGSGYYRASATQELMEVMNEISQRETKTPDVALVYNDEDGSFVGIFTERDFINVCMYELVHVLCIYRCMKLHVYETCMYSIFLLFCLTSCFCLC